MKNIVLFLLTLSYTFTFGQQSNTQLLNIYNDFTAGDTIKLFFNPKTTDSLSTLYCSSSYGNILLSPKKNNNKTTFVIPNFISQKSGYLFWKLNNSTSNEQGSIYIHPKQKVNRIETYLGPPSIEAGFTDYAMLVTIPLDTFNNPIKKNTPVTIYEKHLNDELTTTIPFNGMIAHKIINSHPKTGRTFISSECNQQNSKEYTLEIVPAGPTNFNIDYQRMHDYADGNQITKFSTAVLKDPYGNTVADGTAVNFRIKNKQGMFLQTFGTTINGVATAKMVHPDHEEEWEVQAFVDGFSESNTLKIAYKNAIKDFGIHFNATNKFLTVGPFKSFMQQTIPDGLWIYLILWNGETMVQKINLQTENGVAIFDLHSFLKKNKTYKAQVQSAQITKQLELKN